MYDIIYSVLAHESIECLLNLIENIKKYNKNNNYLIILNLNNYLFDKININKNNKNLIIYPKPIEKKINSYLLLYSHILNFNYLKSNNIKFNYFMFLASNCMFIKQMPKIINIYDDKIKITKSDKINNFTLNWFHTNNFLKNNKILKLFEINKIGIYNNQHEGQLYTYFMLNTIIDFIEKNNIFNIIEKDTVFEEILPYSLCYYFFNIKPKLYCKVFWNKPYLEPNIDDINILINSNEGNSYIVKRVPRDIQHPLRKYINNLK